MAGWSTARRVEDRVSPTSIPARRSAASRSGCESGLSPGASEAPYVVDALRQQPRPGPGAARADRSVSSASCTSTRHGAPACVISATARAPADSAARAAGGAGPRVRSRPPPAGARPRRRQEVVDRVVPAEQHRLAHGRRPQTVPQLGIVPAQQRRVDGGRPGQQATGQAQVVAPTDPYAGRQQRGVPAGGVVPDPPRLVLLTAGHRRAGRSTSATSRVVPSSATRARSPGRRDRWTRVMGTAFRHRADGTILGRSSH